MKDHTARSFSYAWASPTTGEKSMLPLSVYLGSLDTIIYMPTSCCGARVKVQTSPYAQTLCAACRSNVKVRAASYSRVLSSEDRLDLQARVAEAIADDPALASVLEIDIIASTLVPKIADWLRGARQEEERQARHNSHRNLPLS